MTWLGLIAAAVAALAWPAAVVAIGLIIRREIDKAKAEIEKERKENRS